MSAGPEPLFVPHPLLVEACVELFAELSVDDQQRVRRILVAEPGSMATRLEADGSVTVRVGRTEQLVIGSFTSADLLRITAGLQ